MERITPNESGQSITEYLLLISIIFGAYLVVIRGLNEGQIIEKITRPIREDFASAYRYGHPKAKGYEDQGGPRNHPRIYDGDTSNGRIFLNPTPQGGDGGG